MVAASARPGTVPESRSSADVADFYALLKYPGPDALVTYVWATRLKLYLPAGKFRFLDAGCGSGRHSAGMLLRYPEASGIGIDISGPSLDEAQALMAAKGVQDRIDFRQANYGSPLSLGERFDVALAVGTIHHTPDPAASLRNIAAMIKPGGVLGAMIYGARGHRRRYEIREMLELIGGSNTAVKRRLYDAYLRHSQSWFDRTPRQMVRDARSTLSRWRHRLLGRVGDVGYNPDPRRSEVFFLDAFASPIDRAFESPELESMLSEAGLALEHMFSLGRTDLTLLPESWRPYWQSLESWQRVRLSELIDPAPTSFSFVARKT
jgi:SAM-dependent methyltransferase